MDVGWVPDTEGPAMPMASMLSHLRERRASPLEAAMARSRADDAREVLEAAAAAADPDERAANFVARGLAPGMVSDLGQRLADAEAELQAEREKIAKGERAAERVNGMLARGQVGGLEASRMLDGDFGDAHRAAQLERRAARLRRELAGAQAMIAPQQGREIDPLEAASRQAHRTFVEVTRQRMAQAREGRPEPRPFASDSRGGFAVRAEPVTCPGCITVGATPEESFLIHSDPEPVPEPDDPDWTTGVPFRSSSVAPGEIIRGTEGAIMGVV